MKTRHFILLGILTMLSCQKKPRKQPTQDVTVYIKLPDNHEQRDIRIFASPVDFIMYPELRAKRPKIEGMFAKWTIPADSTVLLDLSSLLGKPYRNIYLEPGDSLTFDVSNTGVSINGGGKDNVELIQQIKKAERAVALPTNPDYRLSKSLDDYLEYNSYINALNKAVDSAITTYGTNIQSRTLKTIKEFFYCDLEYRKMMKFDCLLTDKEKLGIPTARLEPVYDSTNQSSRLEWLISFDGTPSNFYIYYNFVRRKIERKYHFDYECDELKSVQRKREYSDLIRELYRGNVKLSCLAYLVTEQGLKEHVYKDEKVPLIDSLITEYYAIPGSERYKPYIQKYEAKIKKWIASKHRNQTRT